jgi:hypothetical protein
MNHPSHAAEQEQWVIAWLQTVEAGLNTMSQRRLTSIEKHAGSLDLVRTVAQRMGVHLLLVEDEEGNEIVAASMKPFKVIC